MRRSFFKLTVLKVSLLTCFFDSANEKTIGATTLWMAQMMLISFHAKFNLFSSFSGQFIRVENSMRGI